MKEMILLTKEEYQILSNKIDNLKAEVSRLTDACTYYDWAKEERDERIKHLWDMLNRPAIEAAAQKHEDEFLDWCSEKSAEYEQKDFDEWVIKKSVFYNNGRRAFCMERCINEEEYESYLKYDGWHPVITENKTEGWTELYKCFGKYERKYEPYWMVYDYMHELFERWYKANSKTEKEKLLHLREQHEDLLWDQEYWKHN